MPQLQEFQFYDVKRLTELFEKEQNFELFKHSQTQREAALKQSVGAFLQSGLVHTCQVSAICHSSLTGPLYTSV